MSKNEPWFNPRPDEDADEDLINDLGRRGNGGNPPSSGGGGWGCPMVAAPVVALIVAVLVALLA